MVKISKRDAVLLYTTAATIITMTDTYNNKLPVVAFAGSNDSAKKTVFSYFTGKNISPVKSKTTEITSCNNKQLLAVDLPPISHQKKNFSQSVMTRDFIIFCKPDITVYVSTHDTMFTDILQIIQISEFCDKMIWCVLIDNTAKVDSLFISVQRTCKILNISCVYIYRKTKCGADALKDEIYSMLNAPTVPPAKIQYNSKTEAAINEISVVISENDTRINPRASAACILCQDKTFSVSFYENYPNIKNLIDSRIKKYSESEMLDMSHSIYAQIYKRYFFISLYFSHSKKTIKKLVHHLSNTLYKILSTISELQ